ncbi:MAG: DUF6384 family protein [Pseudomonadota bacterium]
MAAAASETRPPLDELMMAMDVVDTLRHEEQAVARELGQDDRDAVLKQRLREIYKGQGLEVTERILDEGIAALRESRFVYTPPEPSWQVTLAKIWVARWRYAPIAAACAGALVLWIGWSFWSGGAEGRLVERITEAAERVTELADTAEARAAIATVADRGLRAARAGETEAADAALASLDALRSDIQVAFEIRVVSRHGTPSGVHRVPDVNQAARNYYLIVEAIGTDGNAIPRRITSEETGRSETVSIWGKRVPKALFDRVGTDKRADGIVDDAVLGTKSAGQVRIEWRTELPDGAITAW